VTGEDGVNPAEQAGRRSGHRRPVDGSGGLRGAGLPVAARVVEQLSPALGGELLGDGRVEHHVGPPWLG
jgi:hypothetical protein